MINLFCSDSLGFKYSKIIPAVSREFHFIIPKMIDILIERKKKNQFWWNKINIFLSFGIDIFRYHNNIYIPWKAWIYISRWSFPLPNIFKIWRTIGMPMLVEVETSQWVSYSQFSVSESKKLLTPLLTLTRTIFSIFLRFFDVSINF